MMFVFNLFSIFIVGGEFVAVEFSFNIMLVKLFTFWFSRRPNYRIHISKICFRF